MPSLFFMVLMFSAVHIITYGAFIREEGRCEHGVLCFRVARFDCSTTDIDKAKSLLGVAVFFQLFKDLSFFFFLEQL